MKATGIVRRIDDLGRVVIPKEIRRTMRIREGDPLEIFVDKEGEVILKKYSLMGELTNFAKEYAESLYEAIGHIVCISDRDSVIAVAGGSKKELLGKGIGNLVEDAMQDRRSHAHTPPVGGDSVIVNGDGGEAIYFHSVVIAPIVAQGDPIGAVMICSKEDAVSFGELELKLAETAAGFLAKQMEQ